MLTHCRFISKWYWWRHKSAPLHTISIIYNKLVMLGIYWLSIIYDNVITHAVFRHTQPTRTPELHVYCDVIGHAWSKACDKYVAMCDAESIHNKQDQLNVKTDLHMSTWRHQSSVTSSVLYICKISIYILLRPIAVRYPCIGTDFNNFMGTKFTQLVCNEVWVIKSY